MQLSTEQMQAILQANIHLLENDPQAVSLEFDIADDGDVLGLILVHLSPDDKAPRALLQARSALGLAPLALRVEQGDMPSEEIASADVEPMHAESLSASTIGLSGTRVCEGGGCGTLCLSGAHIALEHDGRTCGTDKPFLFSNSHVFHRAGGTVMSGGEPVAKVACVFDLEAETTFDGGVAIANDAVPRENAFKVLNPGGEPLTISGLKPAVLGMAVAKMGMVSGWTEGKVGSPTITRIQGHAALYPSWKASYRSRAGDSGSPILHKADDGQWYLVGIHFSSGPRFQSWNNVTINVG